MSDLFQDGVPDEYVDEVVRVMEIANWHTYQVLTKRSERLMRMLNGRLAHAAALPHIWWGVSVEDKKYGLPRVRHLKSAQVPVRFLSVEPLLEDLGPIDLSGIHWVIVGGESGAGARPMQKAWVRSIRKQCRLANVPFFFKQWGGFQKSRHGRQLDGRTWDQMPAQTAVTPPNDARRRSMLADVELAGARWGVSINPPSAAQIAERKRAATATVP
jgi:protein gp37